MIISYDTETALIRPGVEAPELACMSVCTDAGITDAHPSQWPATLLHWTTCVDYFTALLKSDALIVGHNLAFDNAVMCQNFPHLIPLVFKAYNENRFTCTEIRQKLLDIAGGRFRKELKTHSDGRSYWIQHQYSLDAVSRRCANWALDKDTWRLRYGELRPYPLDQWPEGARVYPLDDARATMAVYLSQEKHAGYLEDQFRQARRDFWLKLMSAYGLRTHPEGVAKFAHETNEMMAKLGKELQAVGLVRKDGTRDIKAAARLMVEVCEAQGLKVVATKTQEGKNKAGAQWDPHTLIGVALDRDSCDRTEPRGEDDPALTPIGKYGEFSTLKYVQSRDLKLLAGGITAPIHSNFDIVETGRTSSSSPNVQNIRRLPGIRECFVPRAGHVYMQADFPGLELRTLAQSCLWLVGESRLAHVLNSGVDPHLTLAAQLLHTDYDSAKALYKSGDHNAKQARQAAKVANFGFPGGLGYKAFIDFARATYKVIVTEDEARHLKQQWLQAWPEMKLYFDFVSRACEGGSGVMMHLRANRLRGDVRYTAMCNSYFQGLGADATSEAGWLICQEMYDPTLGSVLYGSHLVNYVHDEYIGECKDDERASPRVLRMCELMKEGANRWLPDVPFTSIEPVLMTHWSKDAESIVTDGRVQVWRGKAA